MGSNVKVAVTDCADDIVSEHVPVPEQAPLQPVKVDPALGVAVRVTEVPEVNALLVQLAEQLKPEGDDETLPDPVPACV